MGAALRNDDALDGRAAFKARLARAAVDRQVLPVAARLTRSITIDGVEGGAPVCKSPRAVCGASSQEAR